MTFKAAYLKIYETTFFCTLLFKS